MLAVHLELGHVAVRDVPVPERPPCFALINTICAGICNTDLELQRGYYGFAGIPGHEFVGRVVEADEPALRGKLVVGEINLACGTCDFCRENLGRHCRNRTVLGIVEHPGAFAEYVTLPERNLHEVPPEIRPEEAVFVEPLAAACEILDQIEINPRQQVAVLGDGKLGLLIAQVLHAHGALVELFGRHPRKLDIARGFGIATHESADRPKAEFAIVVECTGSTAGLSQAIQMVRPRGTVIMKSTIHDSVPLDTAPVIVNEISLIGSRCGRFEPALELLRERKIDVTSMISAEFSLSDAPLAFAEAASSGVLKVLLKNDQPPLMS